MDYNSSNFGRQLEMRSQLVGLRSQVRFLLSEAGDAKRLVNALETEIGQYDGQLAVLEAEVEALNEQRAKDALAYSVLEGFHQEMKEAFERGEGRITELEVELNDALTALDAANARIEKLIVQRARAREREEEARDALAKRSAESEPAISIRPGTTRNGRVGGVQLAED